MSNVHARGQPLAGAASSEDHSRQIVARAASRRIKYHFIAAPLDENGPGGLAGDGIVTDSPSNLNGLPYAITAAGDIARVLHATVRGKTYAILGKLFETVEVSVPDDVDAVDIFLCNDAYEARRKSPLFQVTPNGTGLTHVYIHELPQVRLRRLQANAATAIAYPGTSQGQTTKRPDDTHIGYLTGDVWKELAYAYLPSWNPKVVADPGSGGLTPKTKTTFISIIKTGPTPLAR